MWQFKFSAIKRSKGAFLLEWLPSRTQTTTNVDEGVEKKEPIYTAGGNVNEHNHYGKQYGVSSKNEK
jgi:hypothetical protein